MNCPKCAYGMVGGSAMFITVNGRIEMVWNHAQCLNCGYVEKLITGEEE